MSMYQVEVSLPYARIISFLNQKLTNEFPEQVNTLLMNNGLNGHDFIHIALR